MPPISFTIFEIGVYVLTLFCLRHAWRRARYLTIAFVIMFVYCLATEIFAINLLKEYYYNSFLIMICHNPLGFGVQMSCATPANSCVPLAIPLMEGTVIYAAIETSNRLKLPWAVRPVLDGFMAISIDLVMDPIVSASLNCGPGAPHATVEPGLGFWVWPLLPERTVLGITLPQHLLFGIPLNNFMGWFLGIIIFSFMLRVGWRWIPPESKGFFGDLVAPVLAIPATLLTFTGVIYVYELLIKYVVGSEWILAAIIVGAGILLIAAFARHAKRDNPIDPIIMAVPMLFQIYFLAALFAGNLYRDEPDLILLSAVMFPVSVLLFSWPYLQKIAPAIGAART